MSSAAPASDQSPPHPLIGVWRIASHETLFDDGERICLLGPHPRGRLILTACGTMTGFLVASDRAPAGDDAGQAALHRSMIAYGGRYRIEGDRFLVSVDTAWNAAWEGTEQARTFRIEATRLDILSAYGPSPWRPGRFGQTRLSFLRED